MKILADLCILVSTKHPELWPEEVLFPVKKQPVGIFGYNQVALAGDKEVTLIEALVWTGLCQSNTEAKGKLKGGAIKINKVQTKDNKKLDFTLALSNLNAIVLECGKFNYGIIEIV